jgi:hypothetical protein
VHLQFSWTSSPVEVLLVNLTKFVGMPLMKLPPSGKGFADQSELLGITSDSVELGLYTGKDLAIWNLH